MFLERIVNVKYFRLSPICHGFCEQPVAYCPKRRNGRMILPVGLEGFALRGLRR
jgi:hypothetical protein